MPYYPMMQYPMIYPYQHPETMHSAFSSQSYGYAVPEYDGQGNQQDHPSNNGDQNEASTHPSVINEGVIDENETNHQENRNQVTPYRAGIYGRDELNVVIPHGVRRHIPVHEACGLLGNLTKRY